MKNANLILNIVLSLYVFREINSVSAVDNKFRSLKKKPWPMYFHSFTALGEQLRIFNEEKQVPA